MIIKQIYPSTHLIFNSIKKADFRYLQFETINQKLIDKIVAKGNVGIKFDNRVATAQQAVYNTETKVLVLSGNNSKIIGEKDSISGKKITFYRIDGRINVESGNKKRVEAVFYSGQKGIK